MTTAIAKKNTTKRSPQKKRSQPPSVDVADAESELKRFLESPLFGLWKDREDIGNPTEWVRSIRKPRKFDWPGEGNAQ